MNIKQKIIKDKNNEISKNRYNLQVKNCDSTPSLLKARQVLTNKQNNINMRNKNHETQRDNLKNNQFQMLRSMDVPKRLKTSVNDEDHLAFRRQKKTPEEANGLLSSQQLFNFKQRNKGERYESANFGEHMTFGEVNNKRQMTSRQFLEEKQIKNDVIDELMSNARRDLCKSFNEFSNSKVGNCANHLNKKAKYRLVSQLSEGEEEMFYCSKCAINLLQQGFKIQEIRGEDLESESNGLIRNQQIAKFELRLKSMEERTRGEVDLNEHKQDLQMIQEQIFNCTKKFGQIFEFLEQIRNERINNLNDIYHKIDSEKKGRRENLNEMLRNIDDIQKEIEQYRNMKKFTAMKENQFQFLVTTLANKLTIFEETLNSTRIPSPKHRLSLELTSIQNIIDKLKTGMLEQLEQPRTRRERQITFERRTEQNPQNIEEQFGCDELKKPFRILFPTDESEQSMTERHLEKRSMLNSVRECPTFGQYP